jgi:arylsulfatase A-like enzyme
MIARIPSASVAALLLVLATLHGVGCGPENRAARPNVLLIAVDTLRADKLGCYGCELGATPRIDELATRSVRFRNAYAHAPWTLPSLASLLTSLHPHQHGAGGYLGSFRKLEEPRRSVAEHFRDAGYATASVVNVDFLTETFGLTQGFDHVDFEVYPDNVRVRNASRTTDAALSWLETGRRRPFFLLVHYFDPHMVYAPPKEYRARFAEPRDRDDSTWVFGTRAQVLAERQGRFRLDEETVRRAERLYDGEVAFTDHEVGRLLDGLRERGLEENTIVVFTSDHGEEFWDHGGFAHGHTVYEEQVRVPLLVSWPARLKPASVEATVGQIDVAPTLCDLAGIDSEPEFFGGSLVPFFDDPEGPDRDVLQVGNFWGPPFWGWRQGNHKLIVGPERRTELYDLGADPGELRDRSEPDDARAREMLERMNAALRSMAAHGGERGGEVELTPEQLERLRSLGYVQ